MSDLPKPHRRSIRLKGYNYAQEGAYFVTICTQGRACLFGRIEEEAVLLSGAGWMVQTVWESLPRRFSGVELDAYVIMPNHLHGIVVLVGAPLVGALARAGTRPAPTKTDPALGDIVGAFKSIASNLYIRGVLEAGWLPFHRRLWQRNYYEHIIRNRADLARIRQYINDSPAHWVDDPENPARSR